MYKNIKLTKTHTHTQKKYTSTGADVKLPADSRGFFLLRLVVFLLTNFICTEICSLLLSPKMLTTHTHTHTQTLTQPRIYVFLYILSCTHTGKDIYVLRIE